MLETVSREMCVVHKNIEMIRGSKSGARDNMNHEETYSSSKREADSGHFDYRKNNG